MECECVDGIHIYPAETLTQVYDHLTGKTLIAEHPHTLFAQLQSSCHDAHDLKHVKGQEIARKALEVAAAGGHNLLMVGIPGSGKTMLARCLPGILPPLTYQEALETTLIHSASGELGSDQKLMTTRPFRSPHHNASMPAMIGGGNKAKPGEVSLAHHGVLFLDELPEFQRQTLEALRQPLEDGFVNITRVNEQHQYQSQCMLVAGMNPCPCGDFPDRSRCSCRIAEIAAYMKRVSGPLLDRIDIRAEVGSVAWEQLQKKGETESSEQIRARVESAYRIQMERQKKLNSDLTSEEAGRVCVMETEAKQML